MSPSSYIEINGFKGKLVTSDSSSAKYEIPTFSTSLTETTFSLTKVGLLDNKQFTFFSDQTNSNVSYVFDTFTDTNYGSTNTDCWIGVDAGAGIEVEVSRIRVFPNLLWMNVGKKIIGATFEGSNDNSTWSQLAVVDQTIHSGWNTLRSKDQTPYRYIRFKHNSTSECSIGEMQLFGRFISNTAVTLTSQTSTLTYIDGFNSQPFTNLIEFRQDHTAVVSGVNPRYGDIFGGYTLTLTG